MFIHGFHLLMSTHNIHFYGKKNKKKKNLSRYPRTLCLVTPVTRTKYAIWVCTDNEGQDPPRE